MIKVIPTVTINIFMLPSVFCKKIDSVMNASWWGCEVDGREGLDGKVSIALFGKRLFE